MIGGTGVSSSVARTTVADSRMPFGRPNRISAREEGSPPTVSRVRREHRSLGHERVERVAASVRTWFRTESGVGHVHGDVAGEASRRCPPRSEPTRMPVRRSATILSPSARTLSPPGGSATRPKRRRRSGRSSERARCSRSRAPRCCRSGWRRSSCGSMSGEGGGAVHGARRAGRGTSLSPFDQRVARHEGQTLSAPNPPCMRAACRGRRWSRRGGRTGRPPDPRTAEAVGDAAAPCPAAVHVPREAAVPRLRPRRLSTVSNTVARRRRGRAPGNRPGDVSSLLARRDRRPPAPPRQPAQRPDVRHASCSLPNAAGSSSAIVQLHGCSDGAHAVHPEVAARTPTAPGGRRRRARPADRRRTPRPRGGTAGRPRATAAQTAARSAQIVRP